jgi:uncharacterized protein (DUF1919 family)
MIRRSFLKNRNFSIISNNCWGGLIYQYFGLKFSSPFVGLFVFAKDYLKLISNLNYYISMDLKFISLVESKYSKEIIKYQIHEKGYPIGLLQDIEIHFLHYKDKEEARDKWERRKSRLNYHDLIVKYNDQNLANENDIEEFCKLDFKKKIVLTAKKYPYECCVELKNENGRCIINEWKNFKKTVNIIRFMNEL